MPTINDLGSLNLKGKGLLGIEPNELSAPIEIVFELTWRCNLKCMHCMVNKTTYDTFIGSKGDELTLNEYKNLVDQLSEIGVHHIDYAGGEPLLRDDIVYAVTQYAVSEKNMQCLLLTNGILIDDNAAGRLKDSGILKVELNLDGPDAEIYDEFRGVKGSFDKTVHAIKMLVKHELPIRINVVFCKTLYPHFERIIELAASLGARELCLIPLRLAGQALKHYEELVLSPAEYAECLPEVSELKMKMQEKYGVLVLYLGSTDLDKYIDHKQVFPTCGAGRLHCTLGPDGSVRPCPAFPVENEYIAGNIRETSFSTIWQKGKIFQSLRNPNIIGCRNCSMKNCVGGCRLQCVNEYGDIMKGPDPYCIKLVTNKLREGLLQA